MNKPYTVSLQDASDLPARERIEAEVHFVRELEKALGGEEAVVEVYRCWLDASESGANEIDGRTAANAARWPKAADAARQAGLRKLGDVGPAHFEVKLERGRALS